HLLLRRSRVDHSAHLEPIGDETEHLMEEWFSVPESSGTLILEVTIRESWEGKLRSALLRRSPMEVELQFADGSICRHRLNQTGDTTPVVAAPYLAELQDLEDWFEERPGRRPTSIALHPAPGYNDCYENRVRVRFARRI